MGIEKTAFYKLLKRRVRDIPSAPPNLFSEFEHFREVLREQAQYIVLTFPEYTPHDYALHLDHLFTLADRILEKKLYERLSPSELVVLAFGLYAHDWGMAVSNAERDVLTTGTSGHNLNLLQDEPASATEFLAQAKASGMSSDSAWRDYVRNTHGMRSGARLRKHLEPLGSVFSDAVAKVAEGHSLEMREIRDNDRYPLSLSVFGETVNLAALATYVRIADLLDVGEDRTPFALWKFVSPADPISAMEWKKHRALSPVAVKRGRVMREVLISGTTKDPTVFAALADLRSWIDPQFTMSIAHLRTLSGKYELDLDSHVTWQIDTSGFAPLTIRFEPERQEVLRLLSSELYEDDPLAFVRELLQNSVDAIDSREALLSHHGLGLKGEIRIGIACLASHLSVEWADNGIGMNADVLSSYFARLGSSWYRSREAGRLGQIDPISQFGVGILSCFAVSHKLAVETRRDPQAGAPNPGLLVEIPSRESHFRIRIDNSIPVGTKIRLAIPNDLSGVSRESVIRSLARIARFVRHRVVVVSEGAKPQIICPGPDSNVNSEDFSRHLKLEIRGMRGNSAELLTGNSVNVSFYVGNEKDEYHGHYSAIIPKQRKQVSAHDYDSSIWYLGKDSVDLGDIVVNSEEALFVKGVQVGRVASRRRRGDAEIALVRYTNWVFPKLLVNVRHPSYVQFNLARSSARLKSTEWVARMWREIAQHLRAHVFDWPTRTATDAAELVGFCAVFGGVPDAGLESLLSTIDVPVLVLRSKDGLVWIPLKELVSAGSFIEAPFELGYRRFLGFGTKSGLAGWEGDEALFPIESSSTHIPPWTSATIRFGGMVLRRMGWRPTGLRMVESPVNETLPLACRVWTCVQENVQAATGDKSGVANLEHDWNVVKRLYRSGPELFQFPPSIASYGAIGSRYWNISNEKIQNIVKALTTLHDCARALRLTPKGMEALSYLTKDRYIVPSRRSGTTLAIETPNRLLDLAQLEGLGGPERLLPSDFVPGTVHEYSNPYHYDIDGWKTHGTKLGTPLQKWPTTLKKE